LIFAVEIIKIEYLIRLKFLQEYIKKTNIFYTKLYPIYGLYLLMIKNQKGYNCGETGHFARDCRKGNYYIIDWLVFKKNF